MGTIVTRYEGRSRRTEITDETRSFAGVSRVIISLLHVRSNSRSRLTTMVNVGGDTRDREFTEFS